MKNITLILCLAFSCALSAQELSRDLTIALKKDDTTALAKFVNDTNKNTCLTAGTRQFTLLQLAVQMQSSKAVAYLIDQEVDPDAGCGNLTPLMHAAKSGQLELVKALLKAGATTDMKVNGKTALDLALMNDHQAIVALLD